MAFEDVSFITSDIKESPKFFRTFRLESLPRKAVLEITGLGLYTAFINEKKAGDTYLAPGFNDYDGYLRYQELDVTDLLKEGENRIDVYLGNGWYKGRFGLASMENIWGSEYLLAADLKIACSDGSELRIMTDESWLASESFIRSNSIYDGEVRDDTAVIPEPVFCKRAERRTCQVIPELCPPIRAKLERKPELIISPKGEMILDFGQNMAGIVRFHNRLPRGTAIHLTFGEILIDGCFCNSNYNTAVGGYTYISDGTEKDVEPMFTFFGFRYARAELEYTEEAAGSDCALCFEGEADASRRNVSQSVTIDPADYTGIVLYSDLPDTIHVQSSNEKLNRLLQNAVWGQRSNFLDVPTDCPQRSERLGWTGDAQVFAYTACFHMNCEDFYRKYIKDLRYDQLTYMHGDIAMFTPCLKDGAPGGPAWADAATILPWTMYEHYGNLENLREAYPMMRDYVEVLIAKDKAGDDDRILKTGHAFGDWLALDGASPNAFKGGTDDVYVRSVYYWYSADLCAKAAGELGLMADHQKYQALADEIRAAIISEFFSRTGRLCIDTQTGYVLALHFGLYPDKEKLIAGFKARLGLDMLKLKTGFVGTGFLLQTLFENGMADYAYRMIFTEEFPGWFYAVNKGATTIWERWNSVMPDGSLSPSGMNSLNHYSYGLVASVIYSYVAGLRNDAPGWKKAVIEPHPDHRLRKIDVAFDSPAGTWKSGWEILPDGCLHLKVTVPEGTSARIILPYFGMDTVLSKNEAGISRESGDTDPQTEQGTICHIGTGGSFETGAGEYEFEYMPAVDFFHPYNGDTFIADIVADENAVNALKAAIPGVFDRALADVDQGAASNLADAIFFSPVPDLPGKIDKILRGVRYEVR